MPEPAPLQFGFRAVLRPVCAPPSKWLQDSTFLPRSQVHSNMCSIDENSVRVGEPPFFFLGTFGANGTHLGRGRYLDLNRRYGRFASLLSMFVAAGYVDDPYSLAADQRAGGVLPPLKLVALLRCCIPFLSQTPRSPARVLLLLLTLPFPILCLLMEFFFSFIDFCSES